MFRRATLTATAFVIALSAVVAPASAVTPEPAPSSSESVSTTPTAVTPPASETTTVSEIPTSAVPAAAAPAKRPYRYMPKIKKGMYRSKVTRLMKRNGFRVQYKYTYGKKNRVVKTAVPKYWKSWPRAKWNKNHTRKLYRGRAKLVVWIGNGKKPQPWKSGTATWYSIADNTPAGSRATSSGKPLGSYGGWTFASRNFPMGTQLLIKYKGRSHVVTMTDRGGLETIDLYKPASDRLGMGGKSNFKYKVIRRGW